MFDKIKHKLNKSSQNIPNDKNANVSVEMKNTEKLNEELKKNPEFKKDYTLIQKNKQEVLNKNSITREELVKEIEKQLQIKYKNNPNPFKTSPDKYFTFLNSNMSINRGLVPFEEVSVGGKIYYVNKSFENGKIIVEEMYASPELEINLEQEFSKKENTKKQLDNINRQIKYIHNKVSEGNKEYDLIDINDLLEEKHRLEMILDSIKYGKSALFEWIDPFSDKKTYMLRYSNGHYNYLKVTENNYVSEEHNIKFSVGYDIMKKLEDTLNLRIKINWKNFFIGLAIVIISILVVVVLFNQATFEERLFDQRVSEYCGEVTNFLNDQIQNYKELKCDIEQGLNSKEIPAFDKVQ